MVEKWKGRFQCCNTENGGGARQYPVCPRVYHTSGASPCQPAQWFTVAHIQNLFFVQNAHFPLYRLERLIGGEALRMRDAFREIRERVQMRRVLSRGEMIFSKIP